MEGMKKVLTRNEERVLIVEWFIDNFSLCCFKRGINSPYIPEIDDELVRFCMVLDPQASKNEDYIGVFLELETKIEVFVDVTISILNSDMEEVIERSFERIFTPETPRWGFNNFYKRSQLLDKTKNILKNDTLVLQLRLKWLEDDADIFRDILGFAGQETKRLLQTSHKASELSVQWPIDYLSLKLKKPGECLESQSISVDNEELDNRMRIGKIQIYPKGQTELSEQHVSIFLKSRGPIKNTFLLLLKSTMKHKVTMKDKVIVQYTVSLLNSDKEKVSEKTKTEILNRKSSDLGFSEFCKTSDLLGADDSIKRGTMLVALDIKVVLYKATSSSVVVVEKHDSEKTFLPGDLGELLLSPELVRLQVGDRDFSVHKSVLTARSAVFAAMFQADMVEASSKSVTIDDVEPEIMVEVLGYIYTGRFPARDELAERILQVADRYQLEGLTHWCCQALESGLNVVNALYTLLLADRHSLKDLKDKIISFLVKNAKHVHSTETWRQFNTSHPQLANQVYASLLEEVIQTKTVL